jgi:hypothetical protein
VRTGCWAVFCLAISANPASTAGVILRVRSYSPSSSETRCRCAAESNARGGMSSMWMVSSSSFQETDSTSLNRQSHVAVQEKKPRGAYSLGSSL